MGGGPGWPIRPSDYRVGKDLLAGFTLTVLLVPQAMAYALLAGVPPVYGLYAALVPLLVYSALSSTPHVSVGPTALASLLCLSGLSGLGLTDPADYLAHVIVLAGLTGVLQLLFGLLRLGGLVSLLSRPVLSGFVSAAAVLIFFSQLSSLLGIDLPRSTYLHQTLAELYRHYATLHWPTAVLGLAGLAFLVVARRVAPRWPAMLLLVVIATLVVGWLRLDLRGIATVGEIPSRLPALSLPPADASTLRRLLPTAAILALISFIETLSIGKRFATHHTYYRLRPNREAIALGVSKIAGAFFGAIPTSASFSRSAVVESAGGRGSLAGIFAAGLVGLTLLFLMPLFFYLPVPILAAIIIYSIRNLFDLEEMRRLYRLAPKELATLLVTFFFTLFAGLEYGIAGGVLLSLAFVLWRAARPHLAELGRIPGTNAFRNLERFAEAEVDPGVLILRFDAELYFGNAEYFRDRVEALIEARGASLRLVILDAHTISDLDTSGLHTLEILHQRLHRAGVQLYLSGVIGPVRDVLYRAGTMENMGADAFFLSIQDALRHYHDRSGGRSWDLPALQHE